MLYELEYQYDKFLGNMRYKLLRMIPKQILYWFTIEAGLRASRKYPHEHPMGLTLDKLLSK